MNTRTLHPDEVETARLAALKRFDVLDTPPDGSFDRVTALAAQLFNVPIAIVSLVDTDRIWFKSHHGLEINQIDRTPGLCASAIMDGKPYVVTDARADPRTLANPLVAGDFGLQFYAAAPLNTRDGHRLGTLCVIDHKPRAVTADEIGRLESLAGLVMDQMELRLAARLAVANVSDALAQKDAALQRVSLLAKEIDHRVMNSLQMVSAMLTLQSRAVNGAEAATHLGTAGARVMAIARVHRSLLTHDTDNDGVAPARPFLEGLCSDIAAVLGADITAIRVDSIAAALPLDQLAPLGLILSELVTNASKHGGHAVAVTFTQPQPHQYALSVTDDGPGVAADFDPANQSGLGMKVISSLARQLGGELVVQAGAGAGFTVQFPAAVV